MGQTLIYYCTLNLFLFSSTLCGWLEGDGGKTKSGGGAMKNAQAVGQKRGKSKSHDQNNKKKNIFTHNWH